MTPAIAIEKRLESEITRASRVPSPMICLNSATAVSLLIALGVKASRPSFADLLPAMAAI